MMTVLNSSLLLLSVTILIPSLTLFIEVIAAFLRRDSGQFMDDDQEVGSIAILVPAHNESSGIAKTLDEIAKQLRNSDHLIVIADNCSDDTAEIAVAHGAQVVTRSDNVLQGKGFALAFGVEFLTTKSPEFVIVIDADCRVQPGTIRRLATACSSSKRPVQGLNLMKSPLGQGRRFAVAEFAWIIRNQVRPLGLVNLGLPCQLMGTGMAFPWDVIRSTHVSSGNVVEDLELGLNLARSGHPPTFCMDTLVESPFPITYEGALKQRQRWEQGSLAMLLNIGVSSVFEAIMNRNVPLLALGLDLLVPPLAFHAAIIVFNTVLFVLFYSLGASPLPLAIAITSAFLLATSVLLSWFRFGRSALPPSHLLCLLPYLLAKLQIYKGFNRLGPSKWVRSDRDKLE